MSVAEVVQQEKPFTRSDALFEELKVLLSSSGTMALSHYDVEEMVRTHGLAVMRALLGDHLDLRAQAERGAPALKVVGEDQVERPQQRDTTRPLETVFGAVTVGRIGYRARGTNSRFPLDASLNLPRDYFSFGVRQRVAEAAVQGSFESAARNVTATTGARVAKRQAEELTALAAQDFDEFYADSATRAVPVCDPNKLVALGFDGKGLVMRVEDLREPTRKAAQQRRRKKAHRLSRGEKKNAKRMAQVATVYTLDRYVRTAEDIVGDLHGSDGKRPKRPRPEAKRVWASVEKEPETVIEQAFDEAHRRDPAHAARWVALVDGLPAQLALVRKVAHKKRVKLTIVLDIIHVLEYLWRATTAFNAQDSPESDEWVTERLLRILRGEASQVAAGMRRSATLRGLAESERAAVDKCADYLLKNAKYMRYDEYLAAGLPIATGVVEGAVRHLVNDRMDITGARWSLRGAEAVLRLRSLWASGDLEEYWRFHKRREYERNHAACYAGGVPPSPHDRRRHLQLVP